MSEYIYTNLPKVVKTNTEADFSNSVVKDGSVLLFSEDGATLKAKLPDGSFLTVGSGGSGEDTFVPRFGMVVLKEGIGGSIDTGVRYIEFDGTETAFGDNASGIPHFYIPDMVDTYTEPEYEGSSGGSTATCDYYKCSFVDTSAKTWTGYKANMMLDGSYVFEDAPTSGLSYGTGYTPQVGHIYNSDCTVHVNNLYKTNTVPSDGLVLHVPLALYADEAETGQPIVTHGGHYFETYKNIPCAVFEGTTYMTIADLEAVNTCSTNNAITVSMWLNSNGGYSYYDGIFTAQNGAAPSDWQWAGYFNGDGYKFNFMLNGGTDFNYSMVHRKWYHFCITASNNTYTVYVNGEKYAEGTCNPIQLITNQIMIGWWDSSYGKFKGRLAGLRVYNKSLTPDEIQALATEFTPTDR